MIELSLELCGCRKDIIGEYVIIVESFTLLCEKKLDIVFSFIVKSKKATKKNGLSS